MNAEMTTGTPRIGGSQVLAIGAASVASTALPAGTQVVRIAVTVDCFVEFNAPAVATTSMFMPLGMVEYFSVSAGTTINVIQSAAVGSMYITPMV